MPIALRSTGLMNSRTASIVTISTSAEAGMMRRARRPQNRRRLTVPVDAISRSISWVIRKPERTKNRSTPTNPPETCGTPEW